MKSQEIEALKIALTKKKVELRIVKTISKVHELKKLKKDIARKLGEGNGK